MAMRRAATASIQFLNPKAPSAIIAGFAAARSCTSTTAATEDSSPGNVKPKDPNVMIAVPVQEVEMENPFQCGGPGNAVEVNDVKEGVLVRMSLPGVGVNGIKVWTENHTVFFQGEGEIEYEKDDCGRRYVGSLEFNPDEQRADGVKFQMNNGILRLMVPNAEGNKEKNTKGKKEKKKK
ncbi:small heat shock protein, chloroplastic-like [Cornus florida]|uniref:small heat shock protein, chloroplastic-like n=1 Tax=Cornus florida TaxID=4283 RepID=UPI00289ED6EA|nr:small heat shock protein, chloroplastic-like [Cornus florida]